jgi:hypothetical protein
VGLFKYKITRMTYIGRVSSFRQRKFLEIRNKTKQAAVSSVFRLIWVIKNTGNFVLIVSQNKTLVGVCINIKLTSHSQQNYAVNPTSTGENQRMWGGGGVV